MKTFFIDLAETTFKSPSNSPVTHSSVPRGSSHVTFTALRQVAVFRHSALSRQCLFAASSLSPCSTWSRYPWYRYSQLFFFFFCRGILGVVKIHAIFFSHFKELQQILNTFVFLIMVMVFLGKYFFMQDFSFYYDLPSPETHK